MPVNEKEFRELDKAFALLKQEVETLKQDSTQYATKADLWPIRIVVYGAVGLILSAFCTALIGGHIK